MFYSQAVTERDFASVNKKKIGYILVLFLCLTIKCCKSKIISKDGAPKLEVKQEIDLKAARSRRVMVTSDNLEINVTYFRDPKHPNSNGILGGPLNRFTLTCTAPYVTRWKTNITPKFPVFYQHAMRLDHNPLHPGRKNDGDFFKDMFVSKFSVVLPEKESDFVECEEITSETSRIPRSTRVYLYTMDGPYFSRRRQPHYLTLDTRENFILPCSANYPNVTASIVGYQEGGKIRPPDTDEFGAFTPKTIGEYDPTFGIVVQGFDFVLTLLICNFYDDQFQFINSNTYITEKNPLKPQFHIGNLTDNFPLGIYCTTGRNESISISMIKCDSKEECDILKNCFFLNSGCENRIERKSFLKYNEDMHTLRSRTIRNPYSHGMVECAVFGKSVIERHANYLFTGLDHKRYWLSESSGIPKRALIRITEVDSVLHTNKPILMECATVNFLIVSNIRFAIEYQNGTKVLVNEEKEVSSNLKPRLGKVVVDQVLGFSQREMEINVTKGMIRIFCFAPWNNSSQWINTSREFEVRDTQPPKIAPKTGSKDQGTIVFYTGDKSRSLFCNVFGEPNPSIQWNLPEFTEKCIKNNTWVWCVQKIFNEAIIIKDESSIQFPILDKNFEGSWKFMCTATNPYGVSSEEHLVDIREPEAVIGGGTITAISLTGLLILSLIIGALILLKMFLASKRQLQNLTQDEIDEFRKGNPELFAAEGENVTSHDRVMCLAFDPAYEIEESDLIIVKGSILGQGQFGRVYRGFLKEVAVAVKTTKPNADVSYLKAILSELKIMAYVNPHPNIIQLRGVVLSRLHERIVHIVMEVSPLGNLQQFLRKLETKVIKVPPADGNIEMSIFQGELAEGISIQQMINWCHQIANAMSHLALKKVMHGDLATRNVLVFKNNCVKITDFGLSRQLYTYAKYVRKQSVPLPWPWMAVESLRYKEFSIQSDVWSFGVTAWEIFTMAQTPFAGLRWTSEFLDSLVNGTRLAKPVYCPQIVYDKLLTCWNLDPNARPSFLDLVSFFKELPDSNTTV